MEAMVPRRVSFPALGTTAVVLVASSSSAALDRAVRAVEACVAAVDAACSRFRPDSELVRINQAGGGTSSASPVLLDALEVAIRAARMTDGLVDPTVGTAMRVLGYDRDFAQVAADGPPLTVTFSPVPGWRMVTVDRAGGTVRLPPGVTLDLGATAKAWCADQAAASAWRALRALRLGNCGVLVSLGGDVAVAGPPPPEGWLVRVADHHGADEDAPGQTVAIAQGGLATSGVTARRWQRGGQELHHIIDPTSGRSATGPWRTVSVVAGSCVEANTGATAAIILGLAAPEWLEVRGLPARLVATDGAVTRIAGWPSDLAP